MNLAKKSPTIINTIEKAGVIVVAVLLLLRILFGTSLNFFIQTGITLLAVYYLWFGFFLFTNSTPLDLIEKSKRKAFTPVVISSGILMGVIYSFSLITFIHAINMYTGMRTMVLMAFVLLIASSAFLLAWNWLRPDKLFSLGQILRRSAILGAVFLLFLLIPVEQRLQIFYRKHPGFVEAYNEYRLHPELQENLDRLREERSKFR